MAAIATLPYPDSPLEPNDLIAEALKAVDLLSECADQVLTPEQAATLAIGTQRVQAAATYAAASTSWAADTVRACETEGYRTTPTFIAGERRIPDAVARRPLAVARKLRTMPYIAEAYRHGDISTAHVNALLRLHGPRVADDFACDELMLLGFALDYVFDDFIKALRYWELGADPDGKLSDSERAESNRSFSLSVVGDQAYGSLTTDVANGEATQAALSKIEKALYESDWADARDRLGATPTANDLARTAGQRRHDALMIVIRRGIANGPDAPVPDPHFHIVMDKQTFDEQAAAHFAGEPPPQPDGTGSWFGKMRCETLNGYPIHPAYAIRHLCQATVNRIVFESPSCILDYGRSKRFFTGALRQAIILRDQHCEGKGCTVPAHKCEIDHRIPWSKGGPTSEENGGPRCKGCNLYKSDRPPPDSDDP